MRIQSYLLLKVMVPLIGISIFFTSCIPQRKIRYLQGKDPQDTIQAFKAFSSGEYHVGPGDNLYIRVVGMDDKMNDYFNVVPTSNTSSLSGGGEAGTYLTSYTVSSSGTIDLPVAGAVNVSGLTLAEIKEVVLKAVSEYLKEPTIIIKLTSFNITLLGEWRRPGKYPIYQDKLTIFEAVGIGGDLTAFANRKKIHLVRQDGDKVNLVELDLTRKDIIKSEYYYLRPNDIVYAEAYKDKLWSFEAFPYALIFSSITTTLLIWNFFK